MKLHRDLARSIRSVKRVAKAVLPARVQRVLAKRFRRRRRVRLGSLRRVTPVSREFGYDRGTPIDRYYIERFLEEHSIAVSGRVLEVGDGAYTRRFGGARVTRADVLNVAPGHPETTFVADLADAPELPSGVFDALVVTQTLQLVFDVQAAVATLHRILRPGGTALVTVPGISPIAADQWGQMWHWSFTPLSVHKLFDGVFGGDNVEVEAHGNVLATVAFLEGMATDELRPDELDAQDPRYPMLITVLARRPGSDVLP
jgi:SAM-dependent methyltransferase